MIVKSIEGINNKNISILFNINITNECNLHCDYCCNTMTYTKNTQKLNLSFLTLFIDSIKKYTKDFDIYINILGGKPLLYKELPNFLNMIYNKNIENIKKIALITNNSISFSENLLNSISKLSSKIEVIGTFHHKKMNNKKDIFFENWKKMENNNIDFHFKTLLTLDIKKETENLLEEVKNRFPNYNNSFTIIPAFSVPHYKINDSEYKELAEFVNNITNIEKLYHVTFLDGQQELVDKIYIKKNIDFSNLYCYSHNAITIEADSSMHYSCPKMQSYNTKYNWSIKNLVKDFKKQQLCPFESYFCGQCLFNNLYNQIT